jgi:cystathionine beta-lyase/cystathionine gamma-synthase
MRFSTKAIHVGSEPDATGAVNPPVYLTSTYSQKGQSEYAYGRTSNPTRAALERNLAALEDAKHGLAFSSGLGAVTTVLTLLKKGDHVVLSDDTYGGVYRIFTKIWANYGVECDFVDATDPANVERAVKANTKMIWMESPTNPLMKVVDLQATAKIAKAHGAISLMDNTFTSPYLQQPLALGYDLVLHSTTKYLGGHADVIGGALTTSRKDLYEALKFGQNALGAVPSPFDCFLILRGTKTLAVRMERHCDNAEELVTWMQGHPAVARVLYPGIPDHPNHKIAEGQMRRFGGMMSFILRRPAKAKAFLKKLEVVTLAESLGGVESLIEHPASMTHASIPKAEREARGISDGLIRFSVGIEDVEDLAEDLDRALKAA